MNWDIFLSRSKFKEGLVIIDMNNVFDLSICIPTYNRSFYLKDTIESIVFQLNDNIINKVEIVISDNCSTDNTTEMINNIKSTYPKININYSVSESNKGPDNNYIRAISLASGKYCWFLGSDDLITEGSLERVLKQTSEGHTIYLSDRYNADCESMQIIELQRFFNEEINSDTVFSFNSSKDWDYYLNRCKTLGGFFSYLSSIVFLKSEWDAIDKSFYLPYIGTAYVHVAILTKIIKDNANCSLKHMHNPIVINRLGNDSFFENIYKRTMLDFNGYIKISEIFNDNDLVKNGILHLLKKEYPTIDWKIILTTSKIEFDILLINLKTISYSDSEINIIKLLRKHKLICFYLFASNALFKRVLG